MLTVAPAYGRDYKSAKTAIADWNNNKDFRIVSIGPHINQYVNKEQLSEPVAIRYNQLTKVVITKE